MSPRDLASKFVGGLVSVVCLPFTIVYGAIAGTVEAGIEAVIEEHNENMQGLIEDPEVSESIKDEAKALLIDTNNNQE